MTRTTISRIKRKINHCEAIEEYEKLPMEERKKIYEIFCNSINFKEKKAHSTIIKSKRKLTQEQVFMIYVNNE
nr:MAG TPA: hypothetical protein [Caudoviricetes sp.]